MAESSRQFIDIMREETMKVLPSIRGDSLKALVSVFTKLGVETWEDVDFIEEEDISSVLSIIATRKLLRRLKECGTVSSSTPPHDTLRKQSHTVMELGFPVQFDRWNDPWRDGQTVHAPRTARAPLDQSLPIPFVQTETMMSANTPPQDIGGNQPHTVMRLGFPMQFDRGSDPGRDAVTSHTPGIARTSLEESPIRLVETETMRLSNLTAIGVSGGTVSNSTVIGMQITTDTRFDNICYSTRQSIDMDNPVEYVSTYAERSALRNLKQLGSIFINGRSGSGKSRLGRRLLAEMQTQTSRTPVVLTSSTQWDLIPKHQGKYTVLIDDIFGSSNLVQSQVDEWVRWDRIMWPSVESGSIFLVITSRPDISAHCERTLKNFSIVKSIISLDEGTYQLKKREKTRMLKTICWSLFNKLEVEKISEMETKLGFPQCCKYYAKSITAQGKGIAFFEKPHEYILHEVNLMQERDGVGYLALVLVLMRNGCLQDRDLSESTLDFLNRCQQYCRNLPHRVTLADIKHKLESLCGVYLKKQENAYMFEHQSIYDSAFISISQEWPSTFIKVCPGHMMLELVRTTKAEGDTSDSVVCINSDNYDALANRMTELFVDEKLGNESNILDHPCLKESRFPVYLLDMWRKQEIVNKVCTYPLTPKRSSSFILPVTGFDPKCLYLCSLMVLKKLKKLVALILSQTTFENEVMQEMLACAIFTGDNDLVKRILREGVPPHEQCLKALCVSGDIHDDVTHRLFNHFKPCDEQTGEPDVDAEYPSQDQLEDLRDLLIEAALGENVHLVELLVDELKPKEQYERSIFREALIGIFLEKGNRDNRDKHMSMNTAKTVEKLLSTGCEIEADYLTLLAAGHVDAKCLKIMLTMDVDVCKRTMGSPISYRSMSLVRSRPATYVYGTPLAMAVVKGGPDCLFELLKYIRYRDTNQTDQVLAAITLTSGDITEQGVEDSSALPLDKSKTDRVHEFENILFQVVEIGNDEKAAVVLETGVSANIQDTKGNTPLHIAVESYSLPCVQILLKYNAVANAENRNGVTPIMCIRHHKVTSVDILKALVRAGSEVNHADKYGHTALCLAVINNDMESVRFLVENKADVNYFCAAQCEADETGQFNTEDKDCLYAAHWKPDDKGQFNTEDDCSSGTPLLLALLYCDTEVVKYLCGEGVNVGILDSFGETVMHRIARSKTDVLDKFQFLVENHYFGHELLHRTDIFGRTALFYAAEKGDEEVVEFLLKQGMEVNITDKTGCTVLIYAHSKGSLNSEITRLLLQRDTSVSAQDKKGRTSLHYAADIGCHDSIMLLLKKGASPLVQDKNNQTALHYAARKGCFESIKVLLENGADPCGQDKDQMTVLHYAAHIDSFDCLNLILEKGATPCTQDNQGKTALHYSAEKCSSKNIKALLGKGANPCVQDNVGKTALHFAAESDSSDSIKLLLEKYSDPCVQDNEGLTALHYAAKVDSSDCVKLLLDYGADLCAQDKKCKTALHYSVENGCKNSMDLLLEKGANPCVQDISRKSPLHYSVQTGSIDSIGLLLKHGADPGTKDTEGKTALHYVVDLHGFHRFTFAVDEHTNILDVEERYRNDSIKLLLEKGADPCVQDNQGRTAIHYAAVLDRSNSLKLLIEKGSGSCVQDKQGKSPLHDAVEKGSRYTVKLLLENGVNACLQDKKGKTALHYAAEKCEAGFLELLLERGADLHALDTEGMTALHYAAEEESDECTKVLIQKGAALNVQDNSGRTPLHCSVSNKNNSDLHKFLKTFCMRGFFHSSINNASSFDKSNNNHIKLLLENGAAPDIQDKEGRTALHYVAERGSCENAKLILDKGANPFVQDKEGKTALNYAVLSERSDCIKLIQENEIYHSVQNQEERTIIYSRFW